MTFILNSHIPKDTVEYRAYQAAIAETAKKANTLVVLPTGLGKTAISLQVAADKLDSGKILMLAPTKPLVEQHLQYFRKNLILEEDDVVMITGSIPSAKRVALFTASRFCVATPEVVRNDVEAERYSLENVSLLIIDECHRAVGNYAYVPIAERYRETAAFPLILGMTASPGANKEHVDEICQHMGVVQVESRTEDDPDVLPYIHERELMYITLELPDELKSAVDDLNAMLDDRLTKLKNFNYPVPKREALSMKALTMLQTLIQQRMHNHDKTAYLAISIHSEILKLKHGIMLAESQGSTALKAYLDKLQTEGLGGGSKAAKRMIKDQRFIDIYTRSAAWKRELHPKAEEVVRIVREQLLITPDAKIIVFVTYRDSVQMLVNYLIDAGISAKRFVGQAKRDTEKGLSQKEQIAAIKEFKEGKYTVLVATSVGEEGLDIPSTDLVVFYEAVPSEVRSIQRKGRTGRNTTGKVIVLVTGKTGDEMYRWVSSAKEKKMRKGVTAMREGFIPVTSQSSKEESIVETVQQTLADMDSDSIHQEKREVSSESYPEKLSEDVLISLNYPEKSIVSVVKESNESDSLKKKNTAKNSEIKESEENQILLNVLASFPGITFTLAKSLLIEYGSLSYILSASKSELMAVSGMTERAADAILWAMKQKWK